MMIKRLKRFLGRPVRKFMNHSLRTKAIVAFLIIALVPTGMLAYLNYRTTRSALAESANQALFAAASRTAASIDSFIDATLDIVYTASQLPDLQAYLSLPRERRAGSELEGRVLDVLLALGRRRDTFYVVSYGLLDADGQNVLDTLSSGIGQDESQRSYFQKPLKTGQPYVSPVEFPRESGTVSFCFSSPIRRDSIGEVVGVLRVRYTVAILQQLVFESEGLAGGKSSAILLDENHVFLASSAAPELLFKSVVPLDPQRLVELQMARRLPHRPLTELSADLVSFEQGLKDAGNSSFFAAHTRVDAAGLEQVAVVRLKTQPWLVAFVQPQEVFLAPVNAQARTTLGLSVVVAAVVAAVAIMLAELLTRPIVRLTGVAGRIASGDLTARAPARSEDEIGTLARAFDGMTFRLRRTLEGLEQRNRQLYQEITERKRAEAEREALIHELEAKNAELERFVYTVSHDLKSPLFTIRGFLGFVERAAVAGDVERVRADMARIVDATDKMQLLLGELLELSRIGRLMNPPEEASFEELVREAVGLVKGQLDQRGVEVVVASDLPAVYGDRARLVEVLQNLMDNAVKFMGDQPEPRIELGVRCDGEERVFFVRDNGMGVDPRYHDRVFDLFEKLDPKAEGTGVGLAIVKRIVEVHGGRIWVESQGVGMGSTFCFTLPDKGRES